MIRVSSLPTTALNSRSTATPVATDASTGTNAGVNRDLHMAAAPARQRGRPAIGGVYLMIGGGRKPSSQKAWFLFSHPPLAGASTSRSKPHSL